MYYTSVINIHTTPSNELVLFRLVCVSVILMISPKVITIYVATITSKMVRLIATDASIDPISFITCLITPTSTLMIISPMITFISTILIISLMIISIFIILVISLMIISISTILTISMITSISSILIISLMIIPPLAVKLGSFRLSNTEGFFFFGQIVACLHSLFTVHVLHSDLFMILLSYDFIF